MLSRRTGCRSPPAMPLSAPDFRQDGIWRPHGMHRNPYSSAEIDRASHKREDEDHIEDLLAGSKTRRAMGSLR